MNDEKLVKQFYEQHPYPPVPEDGINLNGDTAMREIALLSENVHKLWITPDKPEISNICIIGCGTRQAIFHAKDQPEATIYGFDISERALESTEKLASQNGLDNLILSTELPTSTKFEYIVCTGVLHHNHNYQQLLKEWGDLLSDHGRMHLMLYGKYLRQSIYHLRDVIQNTPELQTAPLADVLSFIKVSLSNLDKSHPMQRYLNFAHDLKTDIGIADTFLTPIDHAFSVDAIFKLLSSAKLDFQSWSNLGNYSADTRIACDTTRSQAKKLHQMQSQWAFTEWYTSDLGTHRFNLKKGKSPDSDYTVLKQALDSGQTLIRRKPGLKLAKRGHLDVVINRHNVIVSVSTLQLQLLSAINEFTSTKTCHKLLQPKIREGLLPAIWNLFEKETIDLILGQDFI